MRFKLSDHAKKEMDRRGIPESLLASVLNAPEQIVDEYGGKKVCQSKVDFWGKIYLLRVHVNDTMDPAVVITAYRTSKIDKYWRVL